MEPARLDHFRTELQRRRTRLIHRLGSAAEGSDLVALLRDVDAALLLIDPTSAVLPGDVVDVEQRLAAVKIQRIDGMKWLAVRSAVVAVRAPHA